MPPSGFTYAYQLGREESVQGFLGHVALNGFQETFGHRLAHGSIFAQWGPVFVASSAWATARFAWKTFETCLEFLFDFCPKFAREGAWNPSVPSGRWCRRLSSGELSDYFLWRASFAGPPGCAGGP